MADPIKQKERKSWGFQKGYTPWNKGIPHTEEWKRSTSERLKGNKYSLGYKHSEETKKKMSIASSKRRHSEETKKKMSLIHKGKKLSKETRRKISEAGKGRKASPETKKKMSEARRGEKHHNWRGGTSYLPYPSIFNEKLKKKIRERDQFTCQLCGRTEREEYEELNRALAVNHIDFNKNNCEESNLNTLCCRCNTKINRDREYWTHYFTTQ